MVELLKNIHFLRPWWFLALLPIAWIIWQIWQTNRKQGAWHEVIAPKFRTLLLGEHTTSEPTVNEKLGYIVLAFAWFFAVLALSGPWVKSVDIPAQKSQQGMVIVVDLSLSMLADDLPPNRLSRVKYKLTDLLKQHPEYATGMVAYAGSAHTISPISEDNQTLLGLLPSLSPVMMPKYGAKPIKGLDLAEKLIKGAQITNGHIIWITDDIEENEIEQVSQWVNNHSVSITLLTVGTEQGGVVQIPNYGLLKDSKEKLIMPQVPFNRFAKLAQQTDIKWVELRPEDASVKALLPPVMTSNSSQTDTTLSKEVNHPMDIGAYFLFFLIPLVAFIFRRGTLLSLLVISIVPIGLFNPQPSYAMDYWEQLPTLFQSLDQQGYQAWEEKKYATAEAFFENPQWRASAMYRQGKYAQAAKLYEHDKTPNGHYNRGNALALAGDLAEAKKAYEKALQIQPDFKEAKENLAIINNLLTQQPPKENQNSDKGNQKPESQNESDKEQQQSKSSKEQPSPENSNSDSNKQNSADKEAMDSSSTQQGKEDSDANQSKDSQTQPSSQAPNDQANQQTADNGTTEEDLNSRDVSEAATTKEGQSEENQQALQPTKLEENSLPEAESSSSAIGEGAQNREKLSEEEQAKQAWLKQIPDQPGLFLKRKFEYQFQQNPQTDDATDKQW